MFKTNPKQLRFYGLFLGIAIFLILATPTYSFTDPSPSPSPSPSPICTEDILSIDCLPIINPPIGSSPSPTPTTTPTPDSQFYDTPTNIEAAVIIMNASKSWGATIYPAIYTVQILGIILRHV